ncbi:MAG: protein kinase [Planctomycetota bacterium]
MTDGSPMPAPGDQPTLPAPPVASLAGHFTLLQELGSGSSGTVYRARLTEDYGELPAGTEVAIKFLRQDRLGEQRARERFFAEGHLGQQVRHPNVAAIHGVETVDVLGIESTYLVMELVQGTTLRQFLQQQGAPVEDLTRRIGQDAAQGLHALHRSGVVHRDIKPENLVLTPAGEVKIVDLGLARPIGGGSGHGASSQASGARRAGAADRTTSGPGSSGPGSSGPGSSGGGAAGSVAYSAPEALLGRRQTPRSDLYALGVVLYEVATGQHPFAHCHGADEMIHAHLHEAPRRPSHTRPRMTPLLEQLLLEMLAKERDARPRDAGEVARILQHGESSDWWRKHEQRAPALASGRRLQRMRRPAETPFCGRQAELQQLQRQLAHARGGRGRAVCISGPWGIGRRRLLDEAMTAWLQRDLDLLYLGGEADPGLGHAEPFAGSLLDWLLRGEGPDTPHAAARAEARARAELHLDDAGAHALIAVATGHSTEEPEVRASRLCDALLSLARKNRALVLRVDAADRLDTSGRLVLQRLLRELPGRHLLLLLTAGPDWAPPDGVQRVELGGLDEDAFLEFGRALFRAGAEPQEQLAAAHATFSGSPGNLIEALEHLQQNDRLSGRAGDYHGLEPGADLRPAPRHLLRFEARVATLPPEQRRVLAAAAVLGRRCALADLVALAGGPELLVLETLSLFRGRVLRSQGGEVAFRHRDFQQALLRQLPPEERSALHRSAADILAQRGRSPLEVGMHRSRGLDHAGCIEPLLQGLAEVVRSGSRRTSLRVAARLQVHLQQLPPSDDRRQQELRLLLLWARARRNAGQPQLAAAQFRTADSLARALDDPLASGEALTGLAAATFDAGMLLQAILLLENAHQELENPDGERARVLAADAHGLHGRILLYLGESDGGLRHVQAALRLLPDAELERHYHLRIDLARLEALRHHYPTALKTLAKVDGRAARHLPRVRLRLALYRGQLRIAVGDDRATQDLRECLTEAEQLALPAYGARAHIFLGERAFLAGRDDEARAEFRAGRQLARAGNEPIGAALAGIHLMRLGDDDDALAAAVEALALPSLQVAWLLALAVRSGQRGDHDTLADCTERALGLCGTADLPLSLHLRALALARHEASARSLTRSIGGRFRDRRTRRTFLRTWENGARV